MAKSTCHSVSWWELLWKAPDHLVAGVPLVWLHHGIFENVYYRLSKICNLNKKPQNLNQRNRSN
ncbi:unnamed protein product [Albugo candida]|uniref:Uncharacterized protein n=1 Tax=Albugo candida TaxID=65357 RepID=A0A024G739_9STRA|nr:unnamed protein product [Albugo candida]|eukprot:CCI42696.1 unnamed protein product [Albugo candida]